MNLMPLGFLANLSILYPCSFLHLSTFVRRSTVYVSPLLCSQDLHEEHVLKLQSIVCLFVGLIAPETRVPRALHEVARPRVSRDNAANPLDPFPREEE